MAHHDLSTLRLLFLAGERLDPDTYAWASERLGVPVIDHWWQTETGWPVAANLRGLEPMTIKPGSATVPVPGYDVRILDERGDRVEAGAEGAIVIGLPLPPGTMTTVWGDDQRFVDGYLSTFPGYYLTGDGGVIDADGYVFVLGRTDDVINVAGHRLSTGSLEAVIAGHPAVAECAVIGVADDVKGQVPRGLVVVEEGADIAPPELSAGARGSGPRRDRCRRGPPPGRRGPGSAEDPVRQDPAEGDAGDRRRPDTRGPVHHRGRRGARRVAPDAPRRRLRTPTPKGPGPGGTGPVDGERQGVSG